MSKITKIAVIDLGTNSVRFEIIQLYPDFSYTKLYTSKHMVRLGDGVFETGELQEEAIERCLAAFLHFKKKMKEFKIQSTIAYATSAMRSIKNSKKFIQYIYHKTGIKIEVISGKKEADLIGKAIVKNDSFLKALYIIVDIGGGSTELILCHKTEVLDSVSLPLGCNRLTQKFYHNLYSKEEIVFNSEKLKKHTKQMLLKHPKLKKWPKADYIIGSSGSVRSLTKIFEKQKQKIQPMDSSKLNQLGIFLAQANKTQISKIPGLSHRRVDLIQSASLVLIEICKHFDVKFIFTSQFSLRDGIAEQQIESIIKNKF